MRQSETLLVDVTLSVRQEIVEKLHRILSCHETSARVTQVCTLAAEVLTWSLTSACRMARTVKAALVLVTKDGTFLCTEALLP